MNDSAIDHARQAIDDRATWWALVAERKHEIARFLQWAAAYEAGGAATSLRLEHRDDITRCRSILALFDQPWWAVVVYSCFDSVTGTSVAATAFSQPLPAGLAETALADLRFPSRSVQHHRAQSTLKGARQSLVSASEKADALHQVLHDREASFDQRFLDLERINVSWWGRTTCFDALLRAGALGVTGHSYRPAKAYLHASQGPATGFEQLWGIHVTKTTSELCEQILTRWTSTWVQVASAVSVSWAGPPYDSADLENALCIYQERPHLGAAAAARADLGSPRRPRARRCS